MISTAPRLRRRLAPWRLRNCIRARSSCGSAASALLRWQLGRWDHELATAAERARLLSWILSLPMGFDTPVGARGTAISGGERQRIALARALLANPAVLILDEPTGSLETHTARALMTDLLAVSAGRATLLITHDLDVLDQMDEIVLLEHGRVVERGSHEELIAASGRYWLLVDQRRLLPLTAPSRRLDLHAEPVLVRNGQIRPKQFHRLTFKRMHDRVQVGV